VQPIVLGGLFIGVLSALPVVGITRRRMAFLGAAFATVWIVRGLNDGRRLPDRRREIRKETANVLEGFGLALDFVVDGAAAVGVNMRAPQLFLVNIVREGPAHDGRTGDEELAGPPHHHREMGSCNARRSQPGNWAQRRCDHRHQREETD